MAQKVDKERLMNAAEQDWPEYRMWVVRTLIEMQEDSTSMRRDVDDLKTFKTKALVYGTIGGAIGYVLIQIAISVLTKHA